MKLPAIEQIGDDLLPLMQLVARHCLIPNASVVAELDGPVFPTVRDQRRRLEIDATRVPPLLLDDNTTPRWAFLWSHGVADVAHPKGWTFAHVWPESDCPDSYTNVANLLAMPEHFSSLTDKDSPLCKFFRYHAWSSYCWKPKSREQPEEPIGYQTVAWRYMKALDNPVAFIRARLTQTNSQRAVLLRQLMVLDERPQ